MAEKVSDEDLHGAIRCLRTLRDQLKSPADQKRIQPSRPGSRNQPGPGGVPPKPVPREESPPTTEAEEMPLSLL